jgi:hypothetical protein
MKQLVSLGTFLKAEISALVKRLASAPSFNGQLSSCSSQSFRNANTILAAFRWVSSLLISRFVGIFSSNLHARYPFRNLITGAIYNRI